jgi:hypothetical protein
MSRLTICVQARLVFFLVAGSHPNFLSLAATFLPEKLVPAIK